MKKELFYYLFAVLCTVCTFTACSDDDDDKPGFEISVNDIVGDYYGDIVAMGDTVENTKITLTKVSDSKVNVELLNFSYGVMTIGDIKAECTAQLDGGNYMLNGETTVVVPMFGSMALPVTVTGKSDGKELDMTISVNMGASSMDVTYNGKK